MRTRCGRAASRRGDRVALFLDNGIEFVVGVYAALELGAVFVPVSPQTRADKLALLLADAGAAVLLTQAVAAAGVERRGRAHRRGRWR